MLPLLIVRRSFRPAGEPAGFAGGAPPPRFGASSAIKMFASMRGPISTSACSAISPQQAVHLGAAHFLVRHFAAAMKDHRLYFVSLAKKPDDLVLAHLDNHVPPSPGETLLP